MTVVVVMVGGEGVRRVRTEGVWWLHGTRCGHSTYIAVWQVKDKAKDNL